jgi:PAS domain-containing protein
MTYLVLNVDSDRRQLQARSAVLRHAGCEPLEAETADQALALLRQQHPALIVLTGGADDPGDPWRRICDDPAVAGTCVLLMSPSFSDPAVRVQAFERGADACLADPADRAEFVASVHALLRRAEREAQARQKAEQADRQLRELEAIYQSAPVGLCVLDRDLRWVRLNDRLAEMNGYPAEAHIGKTPRELLPDIGEAAEEALRAIIRTGEPRPDFEISGETPAQPWRAPVLERTVAAYQGS